MKNSVSLVCALLLTTPLLASDSLDDAFKNGKVNGEIKSAYVNSNFLGNTKDDSLTAAGGKLSYVTGDFYGLKAGSTFQASTVLNDDFNNSAVSPRVNYFDASGAVLSEAYLDYKISNTSLKAGRQFIQTPLVSSGNDGKSSEAIVKDSFEAYLLTNTDIPNTTIVTGYVDKYQGQSDGIGNVGKFENFEDGAYTVYLKNNSIENLTLQGQYLDVNGIVATSDKDALYLQADYQFGPQTLSAQYLQSTNKSQASDAQDGKLFGLKASGPLGIWKLGYLLAYNSSTDDKADVYTGAGEGTTDTPFTAMPVHGGGVPTRADTDTVVGGLIIPVEPVTLIGYTGKSFSKTHPIGDVTAIGAMAIYPIAKNLLLKANYEHVEVEKIFTEDTDTSRVYLTYNF